MNEINAIILADSICSGSRITSMLLTVPQIVVRELLRHRMFSFSSSSMRAIPFKKVIQDIKENMFVPLAFQSHHSGMQGTEYLAVEEAEKAEQQWIVAGIKACDEAERLYDLGVTKQICSRIIEPFGFAKILVTATEFENFFELRCPKYEVSTGATDREYFKSKKDLLNKFPNHITEEIDWLYINESQAEIHIQALAESMWDVCNESTPKLLQPGEWHIPFGDKFDYNKIDELNEGIGEENEIKIATARCARLSYMTFDGEIDYEKDIKLHDQLLENKHYSPFEHCARAMNDYELYAKFFRKYDGVASDGWCNNFKGWIQYRYLIENQIN